MYVISDDHEKDYEHVLYGIGYQFKSFVILKSI